MRPFQIAATILLLLLAAVFTMGPAAKEADMPFPKPPDKLSAQPPTEADFEEQNDGEKDRPFFDDFSWRDFIALNWPADPDKRGVPHATKPFGDTSVPAVWETWKSMPEVFPADPATNPPTPWDDFRAVLSVRANDKAGKGQMVAAPGILAKNAGRVKLLSRVSKLEDINQAGGGAFVEFPLVAQNRTFVRYEIRVNKVEYNDILDKKYYLRANLPPPDKPAEFPDQSISVKAAWMEVTDEKSPRWKRFYTASAKLVDWKDDGTPILIDRTVALIGLHIVHKTPKRKNWIWATFEHVDNTELAAGGVSPPNLNSKDAGMPATTPGTNVPPAKIEVGKPIPRDPKPVEAARRTALHATTEKINDLYHSQKQVKGQVWENYRLIVTQWPTPPGDGPATKRFPKQNGANITMETYHQDSGCINCHAAAGRIKFAFFPEIRAVGPGGAEAVGQVQKLLEKHRDKPAKKP